jgi:hypothetical protein
MRGALLRTPAMPVPTTPAASQRRFMTALPLKHVVGKEGHSINHIDSDIFLNA